MADPKVDYYMPLFVGDYLADTMELRAEEHGAYVLLLMSAWRRGGRLPNNQDQLRELARVDRRRWQQVWGMIARFFTVDGDALVQRRLLTELDRVRSRAAAAAAAGKASAAARARAREPGGLPTRRREPATAVEQKPKSPPKSAPIADPPPTDVQQTLTLRSNNQIQNQIREREEERPVQPPIGRFVDPNRLGYPPGVWSPYEWFRAFQAYWCGVKGESRYRDRGEQDARAMRKLADSILNTNGKAILDAQARAGAMFEMFMGEGGKAAENVHPFAFFVARFDDYRVRAKPAVPVAIGRERDTTAELPPLPPPGRPR